MGHAGGGRQDRRADYTLFLADTVVTMATSPFAQDGPDFVTQQGLGILIQAVIQGGVELSVQKPNEFIEQVFAGERYRVVIIKGGRS